MQKPPPLPGKASSLLDPVELDRFRNLIVFAREKVEGYLAGKHRSPYHGSSAEFVEYRDYVTGEDISQIDWRVYGRSRRLVVRQHQEETDMVAYLMVDHSGSMNYRGQGREEKYRLAAKIAAALAYLMIRQGDKAALTLFSTSVTAHVKPGGTRRHLFDLANELEKVRPSSRTGMEGAITECAGIFRKRGRLVILSDFHCDLEKLFDALGQFAHRRFDILLLQIVDPDELQLPDLQMARLVDVETGDEVQVEPDEIREAYQRHMKEWVDDLVERASHRRIQHALVSTRNPYLEAIEAYLGFRRPEAKNPR